MKKTKPSKAKEIKARRRRYQQAKHPRGPRADLLVIDEMAEFVDPPQRRSA